MPATHRAAILSVLVLLALVTCPGAGARAAIMMPAIDDRSYRQLVEDMIARIPVHNPEWTDVNESDPGFSLLDFLAIIDEPGLDALVTEFHDRPWWTALPIDGEAFLDEFAYSLLEAALTAALPPGKSVPDAWPAHYGIDASLGYAELVARARAAVPEPGPATLVCLALAGLYLTTRRRGRHNGSTVHARR